MDVDKKASQMVLRQPTLKRLTGRGRAQSEARELDFVYIFKGITLPCPLYNIKMILI
jgi:hypothetical protein